MDTLTNRKRGGQPGNKNAVGNKGPVTHGHYTRWAREARWARWQALQAEWKEQQRRSDEWIKSQPGYKIDYDAICEELRILQSDLERMIP
jgi:hypothetical protein